MDRTVKKEHHLRLSQLCSRRPGLLRLIGFYRGFTRAFLLLLCGIGTLAMLFGGLYAVLQSGDADTQITGQALPQLQKRAFCIFFRYHDWPVPLAGVCTSEHLSPSAR